jgi:hypothetical protein
MPRSRADIRLRAGAETLGHLGSHLDQALRLGHGQRLRVRIRYHEIHALQTSRDHVVDGVAAGTADAEHGNPGPQLANVWDVDVDRHKCLSITRAWFDRPEPPGTGMDKKRMKTTSCQKPSRSHCPTLPK